MKFFYIQLFVFLIIGHIGRSQSLFVLIDYPVDQHYYIILDGKPHHTYSGHVTLSPVRPGIHVLQVMSQENQSLKQEFQLDISNHPLFLHLTTIDNKIYLKYSNWEEISKQQAQNGINKIIIIADELHPDSVAEVNSNNCKVLTESEFNSFLKKFYSLNPKEKEASIKFTFQNICLSYYQLDMLMKSTLNVNTRYDLFKSLKDKVTDYSLLPNLSYHFEGTSYLKNFNKLIYPNP